MRKYLLVYKEYRERFKSEIFNEKFEGNQKRIRQPGYVEFGSCRDEQVSNVEFKSAGTWKTLHEARQYKDLKTLKQRS